MTVSQKAANTQIKLKELFLPFVLVGLGTSTAYAALRYFFDIKLGLLHWDEQYLNFWIQLILPWAPILIWIRPKLRILKHLEWHRSDNYLTIQFLMSLAIGIPTIISQEYLIRTSYDQIELNDIQEIHEYPNEKYFHLDQFLFDRDQLVSHISSKTTGKRNHYLNFHQYHAIPFRNTDAVYLGFHYHESMLNDMSDEAKKRSYRAFLQSSAMALDGSNFYAAQYFEKLSKSDNLDGYTKAIQVSSNHSIGDEAIVLKPIYTPFSERLGNKLTWMIGSYFVGLLIILLFLLFSEVDSRGLREFNQGKPVKSDTLNLLKELYNPNGPTPAIGILIALNLVVFIFTFFFGVDAISPSAQELLEVGGNRRANIANGEYWRLLTSVFIHGGIGHLVMNLFGIFLAGMFLEEKLGRKNMILYFLIAGVAGSITSILWHDNTVSVGASGAIFGYFGLLLAFNIFKIIPKDQQSIIWNILIFYGGISLLFGMFDGIDNAAHFGGLLMGFILGALKAIKLKEDRT